MTIETKNFVKKLRENMSAEENAYFFDSSNQYTEAYHLNHLMNYASMHDKSAYCAYRTSKKTNCITLVMSGLSNNINECFCFRVSVDFTPDGVNYTPQDESYIDLDDEIFNNLEAIKNYYLKNISKLDSQLIAQVKFFTHTKAAATAATIDNLTKPQEWSFMPRSAVMIVSKDDANVQENPLQKNDCCICRLL